MHSTLPVENAWPDSEIKTNYAQLRHRSARFQWSEACAHHWWRVYLAADEPAQAYVAWVLFLRSADRRAQMWMGEQGHPANDSGAFLRLKLTHAKLNRSKLKRAMEKRTDKLDKTFLGREIIEGVGPCGKRARFGLGRA